MNKMIQLSEIGYIETPFKDTVGMPIQPLGAKGMTGTIHLNKEYVPAINGLEGFSHVILLYYFHRTDSIELKVTPFLLKESNICKGENTCGVFATRAPVRPNHVGMSIVKLLKIDKNKIYIQNVDILDGTPLLDIKPFIPEFDCYDKEYRIGWLKSNVKKASKKLSDNRFSTKSEVKNEKLK